MPNGLSCFETVVVSFDRIGARLFALLFNSVSVVVVEFGLLETKA